MKNLLLALSFLISTIALSQNPQGLPQPYYYKWYQFKQYVGTDSGMIITPDGRDTNFIAKNGTTIMKDSTLYYYYAPKWRSVSGAINTGDFIVNQYAAKETKRAWFDTVKVLKVFSDSIKIGTFRYNLNGALSIGNTAATSGIVLFNNAYKEAPYAQMHWYDTSNFEITITSAQNVNGKNLLLSSTNKIEATAYNINLTPSNRTTVTKLYATNPATVDRTLNFEGYTNNGADIGYNQRPIQSGANYYNGATFTLTGQGATPSGNNKNGGPIVISSGISTGSGISIISFKTATPSGSGTSDNIPTTKFTIKSDGILNIVNTPSYATNAAALSGGLVAGDVYRNGSILQVVY